MYRPEKFPVAVSVVDVLAAIVWETALMVIEVNGVKSLFLVGVPSQPQPDSSNTIKKPDQSRLLMHTLQAA